MQQFKDGWEIVEVWSHTEDQHQEALRLYKKAGWTILDEKPKRPARPVNIKLLPYRTKVKRKIKNIRGD